MALHTSIQPALTVYSTKEPKSNVLMSLLLGGADQYLVEGMRADRRDLYKRVFVVYIVTAK